MKESFGDPISSAATRALISMVDTTELYSRNTMRFKYHILNSIYVLHVAYHLKRFSVSSLFLVLFKRNFVRSALHCLVLYKETFLKKAFRFVTDCPDI